MEIIFRIILLVCSAAAFIYGCAKFMKPKTALFKQLIVCAIGCMMFGRLHGVVMVMAIGYIPTPFNVGLLGIFGGFFFILTASFGQMDGLVDGKQKGLAKYRVLAFLAPVAILLAFVPIWLSGKDLDDKIVPFVVALPMLASSYYNLKHFITPDVEFGILKSIRGYNLMALILSVLYVAEIVTQTLNIRTAWYAVMILISLCYLLILPVLERGSKKWTL